MEYLGKNLYRLSSGRLIDAHLGIIGLSADSSRADRIFDGYDNEQFGASPGSDPEDEPWTDAERLELATFMIALWTQYAERVRARM